MRPRIKRLWRHVRVCLFLSCALCGCTPGKRPFLIVQMCMRDEHELPKLTQLMQSISQSEGMRFIDNSENTKAELDEIRKTTPNTPTSTLNIGASDDDGVGFGASNLGLPNDQVAVGFSEGSNPLKAHRFADMVVGKIRKLWYVVPVPPGRGALPIPNCAELSQQAV
jgi:hypothetical protein